MKKMVLTLFASSGLLFAGHLQAQTTPFNSNEAQNDLQGNFEAMITYAQNITMPHSNYTSEPRPHITSLRDMLLLVQPTTNMSVAQSGIQVIARDASGNLLGQLDLATPEQLPAHDGNNSNIVYAKNTWSVTLPATWIMPGLSLELVSGGKSGSIMDLKIGAPNELMINTLDLGMLTAPRDRFEFMKDAKYHRDYFQKVPVSKLIINPYESVQLNEVMLPTGVLLNNYDPSLGTWHAGDMRAHISKVLISHGINNANYGMNSSSATEASHPYTASQITAIAAVGRYRNGVVAHGGSGGNGIVNIDRTVGNEWSHEVGHNYGLGHYPGNTNGSIHRPATDINSAWGWDQDQQRFIANFRWDKRTGEGQSCCSNGISIPAFSGYQFNRDAMASGVPSSPISEFTLHTPYVLNTIQNFLESKAVFDETSSTGFKKWNSRTEKMEEFSQLGVIESVQFTSQAQLNMLKGNASGSVLADAFTHADSIYVQTSNGNWLSEVYVPNAQSIANGKGIKLFRKAGWGTRFHMNGNVVNLAQGEMKYFLNQNQTWVEVSEQEFTTGLTASKPVPKQYGVPVTTLVGYYDPENKMNSYLYPALHGAYGFVYSETAPEELDRDGCYVQIYNKGSVPSSYQVANMRYSHDLMNKLHININQITQPTKAEIICNNQIMNSISLMPPKKALEVSIVQSESVAEEVNITPDNNTAPIADAGSDQHVMSGTTITLDGSNSYDMDGDQLSYRWTQVAGKTVAIQSPT